MYKCTECGCEFENKPDFCDCGNDEFVFTETKKEEPKQEEIPVKPITAEQKQESFQPKPEEIPVQKIKYTEQRFAKPQIDIPSLGIFLTCIILSLIVIFFLWNPKEGEIQQQEENSKPITQNIPSSIDKIWNNAVPKIVSEPKPQEQHKQAEEPKVIKVVPQQTKPTAPQTKTTTIKKQTPAVSNQKPAAKTTTSKSQTATSKPVQTAQQKPVTQQKPVQTTKPQTETKPAQTKVQNTTTQSAQTQASTPIVQTVPTKSTQELAQEFANYKASLRNTIGRKIDFTRVIGDGSCAVSFKINENGKLVNRSFSQQSTNMTLNDAVYAAVMSTPSFNPPPEGYKGQFLKLSIKFYNGNFEISLN